MANISQEVNIEMLEKLTDGSYKKKNPSTKASQVKFADGSTVESHKADDMPHRFTASDNKKYKYGFKTNSAKDGLVFIYEEVL